MGFTVIIPSRYASTRLPGKPLLDIVGRPMIAHVVDQALRSKADRVIVATDDQRIENALTSLNCTVCMTRQDHQSGSDRLAEVIDKLSIADDEIVVNVQGDEPLIPPKLIDQVAERLASSQGADMSTAAHKIESIDDFNNPNVVKLVIDQAGKALYFSRSAIPHKVDDFASTRPIAWHHIGIYAYSAKFVTGYAQLLPSALERSESLEQLRVLDNGGMITVQTIDYPSGFGVDTSEDLERARAHYQNLNQ